MADTAVKFTEDEMKDIESLQQTYVGIQNAFGQLGVARIRLENQINDLNLSEENIRKQFLDTQTKEREFVDLINKKYGDGNLDLTTGVFTSRPPTETTEKTDKTL